jgi:hypothetical protein
MITPTMDPAQTRIEVLKGIQDGRLQHAQQGWYGKSLLKDLVQGARAVTDIPVCGTTACVAGWTGLLAAPRKAVLVLLDNGPLILRLPGERSCTVEAFAAHALGISGAEANTLFWCMDDAEAVRRLSWLAAHPEAQECPDYVELNRQRQGHPAWT